MNSNFDLKGEASTLRARIIHEDRSLLTCLDQQGREFKARLAGHFHQETRLSRPTVGDFVLCELADQNLGRIVEIFPRKTQLLRKVAGEYAGEQLLGANLDTVFYVNSFNMDLNLRRMERYLVMIADGGIDPVVVLTKADLINYEERLQILEQVREVTGEIPVHLTTIKKPWSIYPLREYLRPGETVAFLGSSGVGKSTLTNLLLREEVQKVQTIRSDDDKGRHTTTARSLFCTVEGAFIMDTPGIREIQLWEGESGLDETFKEIVELAQNCRYRNCQHQSEPGCAVLEAIDDELFSVDRLKSYQKLKREQAFMAAKASSSTLRAQKETWKKRQKAYRRGKKENWMK